MSSNQLNSRSWTRALRIGGAALVTFAATQAVGCLSRPVEPIEPKTTSTVVERLTQSAVDKIDLLLMIDNSRSMADKQQILAAAVPDLVNGLVNPKCLDDSGNPTSTQPAGPLDECPTGSKREFNPVLDFHIGIVSSSLGGHGSDSCAATSPTNDDHGHLLSRKDAASANGTVATYQNKGFLAWDPRGKLMPPGIPDSMALSASMKELVTGVDQVGCGFESSLEGWYRFLIDPEPYDTIAVDSTGKAVPKGLDMVLLQQRSDFLRPSSLLAVIMLSDENDCSTKEYGQFYFVNQQRDPGNPNKNFYLPKPRSECATDPNNKCCVSCG